MSILSIRHSLEYALARIALSIIPGLPRGVVVSIANFLGAVASVTARHLRSVALANLDIAFGKTKTNDEKKRIVRRSFQTFALMMLDLFWFSRDSEKRTSEWVDFGPGMDQLFVPKAQVCITAHMGNWEVLGMAFSAKGHPLVSVAAPLANRRLDKMFIELRKKTGQEILSKHGAVRGLLKTLKGGGKVALVLDQNTKISAGGVFVDVFGLPAPVSLAPATLALRTGATVFTGVCLPDGKGRYFVPAPERIEFDHSLTGAGGAELKLTGAIMRSIEELLRTYPEHWVWMYKRWKYIAPGRNPADYPFYAKPLSRRDREAAESLGTSTSPG